MRHARSVALDQLEDVLAALRGLPLLKERARGVFYLRAQSFTHFHEDPAGLFADLRAGTQFDRYPVNNAAERQRFLAAVRAALA